MIPHSAFVAAHGALHTLADARRLAESDLGLSYDALLSILIQKMTTLTRSTVHLHRKPDAVASYLSRFDAGVRLTQMAEEVRLPPSMLARVVIEARCGLRKGSKEIGALIKHPEMIGDARLRDEVRDAVAADPYYGPDADTTRRLVGLEYEIRLQQLLRARAIPFASEDELRGRGEAKTPDVLLPVPLLVRGRQVHWIDSKATFGDVESHQEYHRAQYAGYLNRFDAGLVIYWFGYDASADTDPRVMLLSGFPAADVELLAHAPHPPGTCAPVAPCTVQQQQT